MACHTGRCCPDDPKLLAGRPTETSKRAQADEPRTGLHVGRGLLELSHLSGRSRLERLIVKRGCDRGAALLRAL